MTIEITPLKPDSPELEICAAWRYEAFLKSYVYSLLDSAALLAKQLPQPERGAPRAYRAKSAVLRRALRKLRTVPITGSLMREQWAGFYG